MKIISWNVNGIISCRRKGFLRFLADAKPDILCIQEIKSEVQLNTPGYTQIWNPADKNGYSGTLVLSRREPKAVYRGMGDERFDREGRLIMLDYGGFLLLNVYVPSVHVHSLPDRIDFRSQWDTALRAFVAGLKKPVILCGDMNATHSDMDIYPSIQRDSRGAPAFQPEIRASFEQLLAEASLVDVFRIIYPDVTGAYTWWGPKNMDRAENRGSRLDYILVSGSLLSSVRSVKLHRDTPGSDHCPVSILFAPPKIEVSYSDENLALIWQTVDWTKMEAALHARQRKLAKCAFERRWAKAWEIQKEILLSREARMLAVRAVADTNSQAGIDGVRWKTDSEKMRAALSMSIRGYHPLPYRYTEVDERSKHRIIHVPAYRDKAMLTLCAYALDPVAESTADKKSFFSRRGRSALDAHAYLEEALSGPDRAAFVVVADIKAFYANIIQRWLLSELPLCDELRELIRKLLRAGVVVNGELYDTSRGVSLGSSLSPILGNMLLDGLQSYIYDRLYPEGNVDYNGGNVIRFCDDILVTARDRLQAELIMQLVQEFIGMRGLRLNEEKSFIRGVSEGFSFLSRRYRYRDDMLEVTPSDESVLKIEHELSELILNFQGTQRALITAINKKLTGWASYHRAEDSYMAFRHVDAITEGLLVARMCSRYKRWHREAVLKRFWIKVGLHHVFALPNDPSVRVVQLAPLNIVKHKPCRLSFNPYLDEDYYAWLQGRRAVQKGTGMYRSVWNRQNGRCAYCGHQMLPDEEVRVVEREAGRGRNVRNLVYIHRRCEYNMFSGEIPATPVDLFDLLGDVMDDTPIMESPYLELTEHFRLCNKSPVSLTFGEIEQILGDVLDWEARWYEAFWWDDTPERSSSLWREEGFPFHFLKHPSPNYPIADSWLSQGYCIKALHMNAERVVFRRTAQHQTALQIPARLMTKKLPNAAVHEANQFFSYLMDKYGL